MVFSNNGTLFSNGKGWYTSSSYSVDESWKYAEKKKPITKDHILYESIYVKSPKVVNAQRHYRDENALKLHSGYCCTSLLIHRNRLKCNFQGACFMVCELHINKVDIIRNKILLVTLQNLILRARADVRRSFILGGLWNRSGKWKWWFGQN